MTHEEAGQLLLHLLRERWGEAPNFTLRPNKDYGFYLLYHLNAAPMGEVRKLIEETFGFAFTTTFIIGSLGEGGREPGASRCGENLMDGQ